MDSAYPAVPTDRPVPTAPVLVEQISLSLTGVVLLAIGERDG